MKSWPGCATPHLQKVIENYGCAFSSRKSYAKMKGSDYPTAFATVSSGKTFLKKLFYT